jgi:IS5 family transposase
LKRAKARPAGEDGRPKVEIAIPAFGYKNHVSIDRAHGLIRRFAVTNAAAYDGARLPEVLDKTNTASPVWAGAAYRSKANEQHMARNGFASKVHFRRAKGVDLILLQAKANAARSRVRSAVETVFAAQKHRFGEDHDAAGLVGNPDAAPRLVDGSRHRGDRRPSGGEVRRGDRARGAKTYSARRPPARHGLRGVKLAISDAHEGL